MYFGILTAFSRQLSFILFAQEHVILNTVQSLIQFSTTVTSWLLAGTVIT
jgi:hypothetical protein